MSIKVGDQAPDFTLVTKTAEGPQLVKLSDLIGKSNIVLLFVRASGFAGLTFSGRRMRALRGRTLRGAEEKGEVWTRHGAGGGVGEDCG